MVTIEVPAYSTSEASHLGRNSQSIGRLSITFRRGQNSGGGFLGRLSENCLFCTVSLLAKKFNPQNIQCIFLVKFLSRLELYQTKQFSNSL